MNRYLLTCVLLLCLSKLFSQNCFILFTYDNKGNRIERKFVCEEEFSLRGMSPFMQDSLSSNNETKELHVYPNPTPEMVYISSKTIVNRYLLFSENGILLTENEVENQKFIIDLKSYPSGIYFLHLMINDKNSIFKIVKL